VRAAGRISARSTCEAARRAPTEREPGSCAACYSAPPPPPITAAAKRGWPCDPMRLMPEAECDSTSPRAPSGAAGLSDKGTVQRDRWCGSAECWTLRSECGRRHRLRRETAPHTVVAPGQQVAPPQPQRRVLLS